MAPTIFEIIASLNKRYYAPRPAPTPIPSARWDEAPCKCLAVNDEWVSHIIGVMDALDQFDTWIGSEAEVNDARQQVGEIMAALIGDEPMNCCCDSQTVTDTRFTEDGTMQVSYDGGVTWQDAPPGVDPRYSGSIGAPIPGADGDTKRCQAAGSATEAMRDRQEQMSDDAALGAGLNGAVGALITLLIFLGIIGSAGALTPLILAFAAGLISAGQAAFDAAFNDPVWKVVQCAIYCHTTADAKPYTKEDIAAIRAEIASQLGGVAAFFIDQTLQLWGTTGLTNGARAGFISAIDCTDCECGGCSLAGWTVALGTFVSRTNTSITVSSFHTGNQWLAAIQASDINDCCIFRDSVVDPPGSLTEIAVTPCGLPQGTNLHFSYTFYEVNYILAGSTYGPFTIQFKSALA